MQDQKLLLSSLDSFFIHWLDIMVVPRSAAVIGLQLPAFATTGLITLLGA